MHRLLIATTFMFLLGAKGCDDPVNPGEERACPDGTSILVADCDSLVTYDARQVDAAISVKNWAKAELSTSKEVLRTVTDGFSQADQEYAQSCKMYNACALSADEFHAGVRRSQEREREVRACLAVADAAGDDPEGYREALRCLHTTAITPEKDDSLALSFTVQAQKGGQGQASTLLDGETVRTGDKMVVGVTLSRSAHLYMLQRTGPERRLEVLFPNEKISTTRNPLPGGELVRLPPNGQAFQVNNEDIGHEEVFIIASENPIADLDGALSGLRSGSQTGAAEVVSNRVGSLFQEQRPSCADKSRGLDIVSDECPRSRGLTISDDAAGADPFFAGQTASLRAKADPWDDVILQVFSYEHAPAGG